MQRFIKVTVPKQGFKQIKQIGDKYLIHLDEEVVDDNMYECYECTVFDTPNIEILTQQLNIWKNYINNKELEIVKKEKCQKLQEYDTSSAINSFSIFKQNQKLTDYWIDRDLRNSLEGDVTAASKVGETYTFDIRELGISLELNCNKFLKALDKLRQYAYTAYNITSKHLVNINNLTTKEAVEKYDFTKDYPIKLSFNIEDLV